MQPNLFQRNPKCKLCPLSREANIICMNGKGNPKARLMFLGESPGQDEDEKGIPFIGKAGQLHDSICKNTGIPKDTYTTNTIKCHPPFNSKPPVDTVDLCANTYLSQEIKNLNPELIICLGGIAAKTLLQERTGNLADMRKNIYYTKPPMPEGVPFIVTYHPAATFHQDHLLKDIVEDYEWAVELLDKGIKSEVYDKNYKKIESLEEIRKEIEKYEWVDVDLETDGLDPFLESKKILSAQISFKKGTGYYLDWNEKVCRELTHFLSGYRISNHNLKFDLKWLRTKAGFKTNNLLCNDTIINIHLIDENFPSKSLDTVLGTFTENKGHKLVLQKAINNYCKMNKDIGEPIHQARRRLWGKAYQSLPLKTRINYGVGDADGSGTLRRIFRKKIRELELVPLSDMMNEAVLMYTDIECNGIHVDLEEVNKQKEILKPQLNKQLIKMDKISGVDLNPNSWVMLRKLLYGKWGCFPHPVKVGKKIVKYSTSKDALELILLDKISPEVKDFVQTLLKYRKSSKLYGTYIQGMKRFIRSGDLIHATWNLTGTETGRTSVNEPGLHQIPRDGDLKRIFNSRFGKDGRMVQDDISQGELRIIAHVANEKNLIRLFNSGTPDIHRSVGAELLGIDESEVTEDQRYNAKQVDFAIPYGSGPRTVANEMKGVTIEEAINLMAWWHRKFPGWNEYCNEIKRFVIDNHYVRNLFGRYRHLFIIDPDSYEGAAKLRSAINSPIQGGLADFNKYVGIRIWRRIRDNPRILMVAEVHDAYWFDCHKKNVKELTQIIKEEYDKANIIPEFGIKFKVPMLVDVKSGLNLKDMEK